ncbi:3-hydroxyacyl-CoA dehydrogenase NAD-binding domain-containing protein [Bordetella sp. 2513F-2]
MKIQAEYLEDGRVALLRLCNPPVNSLSAALRQELLRSLDAGLADPAVQAIVIVGDGRLFCGGAEIREFNTPKSSQAPILRDVIDRIERAGKPVVAAIHGTALGGGLELALGCHYRVTRPDTTFGLPEVKLGLLPGAGGTQRLPRLIGVEHALNMITSGDMIDAARAAEFGLVDEVFSDDLARCAAAFALDKAGVALSSRVLGVRRAAEPGTPDVYDKARRQAQKRFRGCVAPLACIECVQAAVTHEMDQGLALERQRFLELVAGPQSKAQRHLFFAEREALKLPDDWIPASRIETIGVVGAGTMGGGIAMSLANAGIPVILVEREAAALEKGWRNIEKNYASSVASGRLAEGEVQARLARIARSLDMRELARADLVIEAAFEDMEVKRQIFTQLDAVCKPDAILATNTSRLDIDAIAGVTRRPGKVLGMHFFSPANVMRLLEVVRGRATAGSVLADVFRLARRIGKLPVLAGNCDGFIGNRMLGHYTREAHFMLEEGARPQDVDGALQRFGMAMGPLRMTDMAGLDISWAFRKRTASTRPRHLRYSRVADRLCEMGRFGQKTGNGFYRYEAGKRDPIPDPVVETLIEQCAKEDGIVRRQVTDEEIVQRTIYALVNEGAKILEEGIALRASDIDVTYVNGYGFPLFRGGPMFYAEQIGLPAVLATIREFHAKHGEFWQPAPLLERLVAEGRAFSDL